MVVRVTRAVLLAVVDGCTRRTVLVAGSQEEGHREQSAMALAENSQPSIELQPRGKAGGWSSCCCFACRCELVGEN